MLPHVRVTRRQRASFEHTTVDRKLHRQPTLPPHSDIENLLTPEMTAHCKTVAKKASERSVKVELTP
jgi:hypothetical protein